MQVIRLEDHLTPRMLRVPLSTAARRFDILVRLLAATFFTTVVMVKVGDLSSYVRQALAQAEALHFSSYLAIASRITPLLFLSLIAVLFLIREKPTKKASGIGPRLMAITGTFLIPTMPLFPRVEIGIGWTMASTALVIIGTSLSLYTLFHLGRSFSLNAEARRLVTDGPYSIVRHPLYLCEEIAIVGVLIQSFSLATLGIFIVHIWIQIRRMTNEEKVLRQAFPDYSEYAVRTPAKFLPGIC